MTWQSETAVASTFVNGRYIEQQEEEEREGGKRDGTTKGGGGRRVVVCADRGMRWVCNCRGSL